MMSGGGLHLPRIFQVCVEMKTNVGPQLVSKDYVPTSKDIIENSKTIPHKLLFEVPCDEALNMMGMASMMGTLMKPGGSSGQGMNDPAMFKELFKAVLTGDNFNWYISDFDNLMMGNQPG